MSHEFRFHIWLHTFGQLSSLAVPWTTHTYTAAANKKSKWMENKWSKISFRKESLPFEWIAIGQINSGFNANDNFVCQIWIAHWIEYAQCGAYLVRLHGTVVRRWWRWFVGLCGDGLARYSLTFCMKISLFVDIEGCLRALIRKSNANGVNTYTHM